MKTITLPPLETWTKWLTPLREAPGASPTLVHFWSMSCPSCHANMPYLQKLRDDYGSKGLQVVAVHRPMGEHDLDVEVVQRSAQELGVTEPCALDNDHKIGDALGVDAWPTYYLFDATGKMRRHARGNFGVRMVEQALIRLFEDDNTTNHSTIK